MPSSTDTAAKAYLIPYPVETFAQPIALMSAANTIGRDPHDAVCILDKTVSRKHAAILRENGRHTIKDLGSQNGTFVNQQRVKRAELHHRDQISVGSKTFLFLLRSDPEDMRSDRAVVRATETLRISDVGEEPGEMLARPARSAARGIFPQPIADKDSVARARQSHLRLALIYQLSEQLRSTDSTDAVVTRGLTLIMKAIATADRSAVLLKPTGAGPLDVAAVNYRNDTSGNRPTIQLSRTILDWVLTEKMALVSQNVMDDSRLNASESLRIQNKNSIICVPLMRDESVFGVVYVDTGSSISPLTPEDAIFTAAVANEMAVTLENMRLHEKALHNERMAAIGLTVTNLAHNIKNMISLNQNAVDLMGMQLKNVGNPGLVRSWQLIHESFSRMNHLSADMLNFAKDHDLEVRPTVINRMLAEIHRTLESGLAQDRIEFLVVTIDGDPKWPMDATQLQRALLNLVVNAVDSVKKRPDGRVVLSAAITEDKALAIQVSDNGAGIRPDHLPRIFDLFYTTKGTGGSGLGLPMVQRFVERMGGTVTIDSVVDQGTVVTLTFPYAP